MREKRRIEEKKPDEGRKRREERRGGDAVTGFQGKRDKRGRWDR